jgi:hypothetical protein
VRLPLNSDRDDSGFHRKEFVRAPNSKGTLSDESFHSLKKYPVAPDGFLFVCNASDSWFEKSEGLL